MSWILPKPPTMTEGSLREWAREQMEQGAPRQIVCDYLLSFSKSEDLPDDPIAIMNIESKLSGVMVNRNVEGKALERAREIDKAIELYEANVTDWCIGTHPYERLRVIYSKKKRYSEAIRVCKTFVKILGAFIKQGSQRGDLRKVREEFINLINELEKKNQTKQNSE